MAAPTRLNAVFAFLNRSNVNKKNSTLSSLLFGHSSKTQSSAAVYTYRLKSSLSKCEFSRRWSRPKSLLGKACFVTLGSVVGLLAYESSKWLKVHASTIVKPSIPPSRKVVIDTDDSGLKLTLFQYQTCPFCCKVRAVLDYYGFSYNIVEVNSISKGQLKWSEYKKVPLLMLDGVGENGFLVMRDSCVIVSLLESYLEDKSHHLEKLLSYYPCYESKEGRKTVYDFPNKYFIMYGEKKLKTTPEERQKEIKWRKWADSNLVHMLSPNVYRTPSEALQAFHYFSEVGQWDKNFSTMERWLVIYLGATVMYFIGKRLKKKYSLKDDVRQSLFDSCNEWTQALGRNQKFMGGDSPNLADLAVYGVLSSIEGCDAFKEVLSHTNIGPWYLRTKTAVKSHAGAHPLAKKT